MSFLTSYHTSNEFEQKHFTCIDVLVKSFSNALYGKMVKTVYVIWNNEFEHPMLDIVVYFNGVIHAIKMFKSPFLLKIYWIASQKFEFTPICSDDLGFFVTFVTTVHWPLRTVIVVRRCAVVLAWRTGRQNSNDLQYLGFGWTL